MREELDFRINEKKVSKADLGYVEDMKLLKINSMISNVSKQAWTFNQQPGGLISDSGWTSSIAIMM